MSLEYCFVPERKEVLRDDRDMTKGHRSQFYESNK